MHALQSYVDMILTLPAVQEWAADARAHGQFYAEDEPYRTGPDPADDSSK